MTTVFFGTSKYCLPVLESLKNNFDLKLVIVVPDKPVGRKQMLTPCTTKVWAQKNHVAVSENLDIECDLAIVADYGKIIKKELFNKPKLGIFNIHFSKLPEFRGPSPVQFTLLRGDKTAWVSIFKLKHYPELKIKMDSGPILWQREYPVLPDDTTESLYTRLFVEVAHELPKINFNGPFAEQDHSKATFTRFLTRQDGFVEWETLQKCLLTSYADRSKKRYCQNIYNQFRAMFPWPGLWTLRQAQGKLQRMKILKCHLEKDRLIFDLIQFEGERPRVDF